MVSASSAGITKVIQDQEGLHTVDISSSPEFFSNEEKEQGYNKDVMQAEYIQAINDLNTITNTTNPTNAQIVWAIKRLAEIEKQELKYHKKDIMQ